MVTFHVAHFMNNQQRLSMTFLNLRHITYTSSKRFPQIYSQVTINIRLVKSFLISQKRKCLIRNILVKLSRAVASNSSKCFQAFSASQNCHVSKCHVSVSVLWVQTIIGQRSDRCLELTSLICYFISQRISTKNIIMVKVSV